MKISVSARIVLSVFKKDIESKNNVDHVSKRAIEITQLLFDEATPEQTIRDLHHSLHEDYEKGALTIEEQYIYAAFYDYGICVPADADRTFRLYEEIANKGYIHARREVACCINGGVGVEQDQKKARQLYQALCAEGHPIAQFEAYKTVEEGVEGEIKPDSNEAMRLLKASAAQDYPYALYELAMRYIDGEHVEKDAKQAFELFSKAAEQKHLYARTWQAICFAHGMGTEVNLEKAYSACAEAEKNQDADFFWELAWFYIHGYRVKKDEKRAFDLMVLADRCGHKSAATEIGWMYEEGTGVTKDEKQAADYYLRAADKGDKDAKFCLSGLLRDGRGIEQNQKKAFQLAKEAADQGHIVALVRVGYFYQEGIGVEKDEEKAIEWYKKADAEGNAEAAHNLGLLALSEDTKPSRERAIAWFEKAAKKEYTKAYIQLGFIFKRSPYYDKKTAIKWFALAAPHNENAKFDLIDLYLDYNSDKDQRQEGIKLLKEMIAADNIRAMYELANYHYSDCKGFQSTPEELKEAYDLFQKAAEKGHPDAKIKVAKCLLFGKGVAKDVEQGMAMLEKIGETAGETMHYLGTLADKTASHTAGEREDFVDTEENHPRAFGCYHLSAQANYPLAQWKMAKIYQGGYQKAGIKKNLELAKSWLLRCEKTLETTNGTSKVYETLAKAYYVRTVYDDQYLLDLDADLTYNPEQADVLEPFKIRDGFTPFMERAKSKHALCYFEFDSEKASHFVQRWENSLGFTYGWLDVTKAELDYLGQVSREISSIIPPDTIFSEKNATRPARLIAEYAFNPLSPIPCIDFVSHKVRKNVLEEIKDRQECLAAINNLFQIAQNLLNITVSITSDIEIFTNDCRPNHIVTLVFNKQAEKEKNDLLTALKSQHVYVSKSYDKVNVWEISVSRTNQAKALINCLQSDNIQKKPTSATETKAESKAQSNAIWFDSKELPTEQLANINDFKFTYEFHWHLREKNRFITISARADNARDSFVDPRIIQRLENHFKINKIAFKKTQNQYWTQYEIAVDDDRIFDQIRKAFKSLYRPVASKWVKQEASPSGSGLTQLGLTATFQETKKDKGDEKASTLEMKVSH